MYGGIGIGMYPITRYLTIGIKTNIERGIGKWNDRKLL